MLRNLYRETQERLQLAEKIPFLQVLDDGCTIATKNASLVQVIKLNGKNYSGISQSDLEDFFQKRTAFFNNLTDDIRLSIFSQRKRMNLTKTPIDYGNEWVNKIGATRAKEFTAMYRTEIYLVVRLGIKEFIEDKLGIGSKKYRVEQERLLLKRAELEAKVSEITKLLEPYQPKVLFHNPAHMTNLFDFWSYITNVGRTIPTPYQSEYLGRILGVSDIEFFPQEGLIKIYDEEGSRYAAILGINAYPHETHSTMLDLLMQARHPFTVIQQVIPDNQDEVKGKINHMIASMQSIANVPIAAAFLENRMSELDEVGNLVDSSEASVMHHAFSILVYGDTKKDLEEGIRKIKSALIQNGISIIQERMNLESTFWAQFPDNEPLNASRQYMVTTDNIADFITFGTSYEGLTECAFGKAPVSMFRTREDTQFAFTFHANTTEQAPGHTMLIGPTGAGKSVLAMHMLKNCLQYQSEEYGNPLKMLLFDSGQGLKIPVCAFGGEYIDIGNPENIPMNPMLLKDTPANRLFLQEWFAMLVGGQEHLSEPGKNILSKAVAENFDLPENERCLHSLRALFLERRNDDRDTLHERLKKWLPDQDDPTKFPNPNAQFFNSNRDALDFKKRMVAFDMAYCLKNKELLAPLAGYIFHAFTQEINRNPGPHICFIDEMAQYLENDIFAPFILKLVREARKRNGVFFGAIQEPGVLIHSNHGQAIVENLVTFLVLKNTRAKQEEYEALGFTDREIDWIKTPGTQREIMVKRNGGESIVLKTDLSSIGNLIRLYSGSLEDVVQASRLMAEHPKEWVARYLKTKEGGEKIAA